MKNFVKALDRNGPAFSVPCDKFPRLGMEKIRLGVLTDPQTALQRIRSRSQWWQEGSLQCLLTCCNWFSRKRERRQLQEACGGSHNLLQESSLFTLGFLAGQLWCRMWWRWSAFSPGYLSNGEQIRGQMECCHVGRLLQEGEEGCSGNSARASSGQTPHLIQVSSI
jgi:hypothetical protein